MLQHTIQDIRYAFRLLLKTPGFSLIAVVTLALGIGANTAIFTVVNAVLLRPLPYGHPDRLVTVWQDMRARGGPPDEWATPGNYVDWRSEKDLFQRVAVITGWQATLLEADEPEPLLGEQVSHEYFDVLEISPALGRSFTDQDDRPNAARVVVISNGLWKRRFGTAASVIGRMVTINGEPHEIVGVLPAGVRPIVARGADVWRPLRLNRANPARGAVILRTIARLAPDLSITSAQAAATTLAHRLEAAHPDFNDRTGITLIPLHERVVGNIKPGLLALTAAVACVLLIACANIANLLLARGSARGRELAVRLALGAGRGRLTTQLLTESSLLAAIGGAAGVVLGLWAVDALIAMAPASAPRIGEVRLDASVLAFAASVTLLTGLLFGLAPALQSARSGVAQALKDGARGGQPGGRGLRRALVAAEVALALVLLTGGALLLQTFVRLQSTNLGFDPANVLVALVNPPRTSYATVEQQRVFYDAVLEKASALPGVERAALASVLPLSGDSDRDFVIEHQPKAKLPSDAPVTWYRLVSAGYFDTMGIPIVRGHGFTAGDASLSVVINETLARKYFPGEDPIGRRVRFDRDGAWFMIVGVASNVKARGAREEPKVETYIPYWQVTERGMNVILKTRTTPAVLTQPLKQAVSSLDRSVALSGVSTLETMVADSIEQPRFLAALTATFALLALTLAAIGIYGVMAYVVSQRTTEIGVRMALGAAPIEVFKLVVSDGLRLTALGIVLGTAGSVAAASGLTSLLFGVRPGDPTTVVAMAGVLLAVAIAACAVPARRATRVDPMVALRAE